MNWLKKAYRNAKKQWDRTLRPKLEPIIRVLVLKKAKKELEKWND